jgi:energy-coupling factor transporter ATP-binding protein EcfA2
VYSNTPVVMPIRNVGAVFVCGPRGSGKSTFANFLGVFTGWRAAETSHVLMRDLARMRARNDERRNSCQLLKEIENQREKYREHLISLGDFVCGVRATYLIDECLRDPNVRIITGVRREREVIGRVCDTRVKGNLRDVWVLMHRSNWIAPLDPWEPKCLGGVPDVKVIVNDNLAALQTAAKELAKELLK